MDKLRLKQRILVSGNDTYNTQMLYFTCSSVSADDKRIYLISDRDGHPNVWVHDLETGKEKMLTKNTGGYIKSYVYFDGVHAKGLGKASVCLDPRNDVIYYIQDDKLCSVGLDSKIRVLNTIPDDRVTAFTHVSNDGTQLCVPMTDGRCLDFDPETEGTGLDKRPKYDIDGRVQAENLSSYLCVYDTFSGKLLYDERVPKCWITHVQFDPADKRKILYNHEWSSFDCGIRRMWLFDGKTHKRLRTEGKGRSRNDWVCHEMWSDNGQYIIYHGAFDKGPAFVGRVDLQNMSYSEIALPDDYNAYGHFNMNHSGDLVCDGYFRFPHETRRVLDNSTDSGPDPHKKDACYITTQKVDWDKKTMEWTPLCSHDSDWMGQDAHPHPIYSHAGDKVFFSSRLNGTVKVFYVPCN